MSLLPDPQVVCASVKLHGEVLRNSLDSRSQVCTRDKLSSISYFWGWGRGLVARSIPTMVLQGLHVTNTRRAQLCSRLSFCLAPLHLIMNQDPPCPLHLPVGIGEVVVQVEVSYNTSFLDHLIYLSTTMPRPLWALIQPTA